MKTPTMLSMAVLAVAAIGNTAAQARYLCDRPPTSIDRRACEAAEQGPAALRHFIQRMRAIESLQFSDYVNEARLLAWDAKEEERTHQRGRTAELARK